jgi:Trk K+ transport system NAD-binding subunit
MEFPVEMGSKIANKFLKDIEWPSGSLIVGLRRGSDEIIPKGNTKILPGDYLLILAPENKEYIIRKNVINLVHK